MGLVQGNVYDEGRDINSSRSIGEGKGCKRNECRKIFFKRKSHRGRRSVPLRRLGN